MLKLRILTALILAPLFVLALFKLPSEYFSLLIGLIILFAGWEWCNLISIESKARQMQFILALILPMLFIQFWAQFLELFAQTIELSVASFVTWAKESGFKSVSEFLDHSEVPDIREYSDILEWLVIPSVLFWIITMILIRNAPSGLLQMELRPRYKALIGWFVLFSAWMFFTRLRTFYGTDMAFYLLALIWLADISAYFAGKKYGTTKMAPEISPGKTVAGLYGALISAAVCGLLLNLFYRFHILISADFVLLSILTVLISIYGDLFFSLVKRKRGVKDSGTLLPGHGGILDRIDSLIAAIPFFYAGIFLIYRTVS
jgi:phosphatidate cytidylyltransferase